MNVVHDGRTPSCSRYIIYRSVGDFPFPEATAGTGRASGCRSDFVRKRKVTAMDTNTSGPAWTRWTVHEPA
ncbi:hypothetical protein J6590_075064 [Homalodisca vitripennis]|nr:hypothetical protein J6590_075064 [Homalodisca vitripennis]